MLSNQTTIIMKKILTAIFIIALVSPGIAQTFSVRAGMNLANMLVKDDYDTYSEDYKLSPGFHFGGNIEFPKNGAFAFETGLLLSTTGFRIKETNLNSGDYKAGVTIYNLNIPLTAKAYVNAGANTKVYFNLGPYIGFALSGKFKSTYAGETDKEDIEIGYADDDAITTVDFGIQGGVGVEIKSFIFGANYGWGLANISSFTDDGSKINNRVLGIYFGYKFIAN